MGNALNSSDKRDYDKNWSPYSDDFGAFSRKKSKRWSLKKPKGYYKTVSELDLERGLPSHLHYQSPNSVEEDLFTVESRSPCVIHLHQRTRQDINHHLRGSNAHPRVQRPNSFDARLLLDSSSPYEAEFFSPNSNRNSSFISSPGRSNTKHGSDLEFSQNISERSTRQDTSSSGQGDIVTVDTSGAKFDRQANLRRSQRLSTSGVRQRANAAQRRQQRHKHRTLIALPGNISSELGETPSRPYSVVSQATNYSEGRSFKGHDSSAASPRQVSLRSVEIQTDDVKVIPITPSQKRMRQKIFNSSKTSPTSSRGSTKYLTSPTAVSCQTNSMMKQTSTPINGAFDSEQLIRPSSLDVKNTDTSTDEGRHTGESSPPTPVRTGTPQELVASPQLKKSQKTIDDGTGDEPTDDIAMRLNGGRLHQGEDRASSGCWSGTESIQHSSSSDITMQHAPVVNALQQALRNDRLSAKFANSIGQVSPIVNSKPLVMSSAVSSSTVSINSKLSHLDLGTSTSSLCRDSDERLDSPASSVVSVTINRSHQASDASLDSGRAISAASMVKLTRKSRSNGASGVYNFMNYECDPLETENLETKILKNRRSTRKGKSKKRLGADDTVSLHSVPDSSPRHAEVDGASVYSAGKTADDTISLGGSTFSGDQDDNTSPTHSEQARMQSTPPSESAEAKNQNGMYDSYHRAIKSNHTTPQSLLTSRQKSASVKVNSVASADFQSELNRRLSVRTLDNRKSKKGKRGAPPPPPKRQSSLSSSGCPSPSLSMRSETISQFTNLNSPRLKPDMRVEDYYRTTPPPKTPNATPAATPSPSRKSVSPLVNTSNGFPVPPATAPLSRKAISPIVPTTPKSLKPAPLNDFYQSTPPPPPPMDQLPPPPPELLTPIEEDKPLVTPAKSPLAGEVNSPMQSIAMQAALLGNRMSQKKRNDSQEDTKDTKTDPSEQNVEISAKTDPEFPTSPVFGKELPSQQKLKNWKDSQDSKELTAKTESASNAVFSKELLSQQKSKLKSQSNSESPVSPESKSSVTPSRSPEPNQSTTKSSLKTQISKDLQTSSSTDKVVVKTPISTPTKSPPPIAPKGFSVKNKSPPPISQKPKIGGDFASKRSREQSPSYRASLARAAFFASKSQTIQPDKPEKVSLVSTPAPVADQQAENVSEPTVNDTPDSKSSEDKVSDSPIQPASCSDDSDDNKTEESSPWMEELETLSPSVRKETGPPVSAKPAFNTKSPSNHSKYDDLMTAIYRSKREALNGKPSPPVSPGVNGEVFTYHTNGASSPVSTIERKRNGRLSSNGHRNAISRKSTGSTSRDDFKALLLQNACRGTASSQMSAAEKLSRNKPATSALSRLRPNTVSAPSNNGKSDGDDAEASPRPDLSLSEIRSAITSGSATTSRIGRTNRRSANGADPKYATLSVHGKRHPPQSTSSKYNSRSRTPTRPMMSIQEDNEIEKSPDAKQLRAVADNADT